MRVYVAGATGFIGRALGATLAAQGHTLVGLSRSASADPAPYHELRVCDLFSLRETEEALAGAEVAYYLVHSMLPSARLTQGSFADFDLICADNFGRAAKRAGVRQIIYLGGLAPDEERTSPHLASRLEVERELGAAGVPVTALRAGLVIGAGGSSFEVMLRLVRRLPLMVCPRWTSTRTQPIALGDVVTLLAWVLDRESTFGRSYDVGGRDVVTYREMMGELARQLGLKRPMIPVPWLSPRLSRLWVSTMTGAPRELVAPLVRSLEHEMVARDDVLAREAGLTPLGLADALARALADEAATARRRAGRATPHAFVGARGARATAAPARRPRRRTVRSVQRMVLPPGRDAAWAADEYRRWLPRALAGLLHVIVFASTAGDRVRFVLGPASLGPRGMPLLELTHAPGWSSADRQLFYVTGGVLHHAPAPSERRARFELRQVLDGDTLLTAIHDYQPRLPWLLYTLTQALVHALVMSGFRRHLRALQGASVAAARA